MNTRQQGLYPKFNVSRTDGGDQLGGKHHGAEYFVLDLSDDPFAIPAAVAYAAACRADYPVLAADLERKAAEKSLAASEFVTVPETPLPNGLVVPSFRVAKYLSSRGPSGVPVSLATGTPWVEINYNESCAAAASAGLQLLTETQALAIAWNVAYQDINWTGGKVGEGALYQGLHRDTFDSAQPGNVESDDAEERRWLQLSNGERIYDVAGNAFTWVFDDVHGNKQGLVARRFEGDDISLQAPYGSREKGMGWRPDGARDWSGDALIRGGHWDSGSIAGAFSLNYGWPGSRIDYVGFRCTKP